jgi:hypothetical protein
MMLLQDSFLQLKSQKASEFVRRLQSSDNQVDNLELPNVL